MMPIVPAPTFRLPATTCVGSFFTSRLATLYGARIGTTSSTPGPLSSDSFVSVALLADGGDHGPLGALNDVGLEAQRLDPLDHVLNLLGRWPLFP